MMKQNEQKNKAKPSKTAGEFKKSVDNMFGDEKLFRMLTEQSSDIILLINRDSIITYTNAAAEKVLGLKREEIVGSHMYKYLHPDDLTLVTGIFEKFFNDTNSNVQRAEIRISNKDGAWHTVEATGANLIYGNTVEAVLVNLRDVTEHKKVEEALKNSEAMYHLLADNITEHVWIMDLKLKLVYISPSVEKIYGYTVDEVKKLKMKELFTADSYHKISETLSAELAQAMTNPPPAPGTRRVLELQARHKKGHLLWIENRLSFIRDKNGKPVSIMGETRDVTERKLAEEKLRNEEKRFRALAEQSSDIIALVNAEGKVVYHNPALRILGYSPEERFGANAFELVHPDDLTLVSDTFRKLFSDAKALIQKSEVRLRHKDGSWRTFEAMGSNLIRNDVVESVIINLRDITDRKKAENMIRESEEKYRLLADHMKDQVWLMDMNMNITYVSPSVEKLIGYSSDEIKKISWDKILTPESLKKATDFISIQMPKALKSSADYVLLKTLELEFILKNGQTVWGECAFSFIRDENGKAVSILGEARNVTERKLTQEKLHRSEEKYRTILEDIQEGYFEVDLSGNFTFFNDTVCRVTGYSKEELMGMNNQQYSDQEDLGKVFQAYNKVYTTGEPYRDLGWQIIRKDGTKRHIEGFISLRKDSSGKPVGFRGIARDITERKLAEEKLQQTLESLKKAIGTTIQVLVSALEARDPYTAGHQSRSADLACAIAREMGLDEDKIEAIKMAGIIHDIGKLSIPAEILTKPTKLTNLEFSLIKVHPQSGYEMLKNVESPWALAQIVQQHHERMDGSGYPGNLKGKDILIESRILAVADVVEAMASHRPYRASLGLDAAINEIEKNRGILYDKTVVDACLRLFRDKGYKLS
jgi:PAS domain S-box-containing protein